MRTTFFPSSAMRRPHVRSTGTPFSSNLCAVSVMSVGMYSLTPASKPFAP